MIAELNKLYLQATDDHIKHGMTWYNDAHHMCKRIAKHTNTDLYKVVGVLAALSPRNKWHRNISDCVDVIRKGKKAKVCTFNANKNKALKILKANSPSEVYAILNGRKVQSFYNNILKPFKSDTVTVDVWAMRKCTTQPRVKRRQMKPKSASTSIRKVMFPTSEWAAA